MTNTKKVLKNSPSYANIFLLVLKERIVGNNSGKYFDVEATASFFADVNSAYDIYSANTILMSDSFKSFSSTDSWRGSDAVFGKKLICDTENQILSNINFVQKNTYSLCCDILEKFRLEVDSAPNAYISYDVLETINKDFQSLFISFNEQAVSAKNRAISVISKYSKYGSITQPDFSSAEAGYEDLCGKDQPMAGYIYSCMEKLVQFDAQVVEMIKALQIKNNIKALASSVGRKTAACASSVKDAMISNAQVVYIGPASPGMMTPNEFELFRSTMKLGWENFIAFFKGVIPKNATNEQVVGFFEYMRYARYVPNPYIINTPMPFSTDITDATIEKHYEANKVTLTDPTIYTPGNLIENQAEWETVLYGKGKSNMSYSGCEVIASINAMTVLKGPLTADEVADIIKDFEKDGMVWNGKFGTSPIAIKDYFDKNGYTTESTLSTDPTELEKVASQSDVIIITVYNDKEDITDAVHTMCVTKDAKGQYQLHNSYLTHTNSDGTTEYVARTGYNFYDPDGYNSIQEVLDGYGNCGMIMLTGISDTSGE